MEMKIKNVTDVICENWNGWNETTRTRKIVYWTIGWDKKKSMHTIIFTP